MIFDILNWFKVKTSSACGFSNGFSHLDWSIYLILKKKKKKKTQCKNHFNTNLVIIHSGIIEILSFSCFTLFWRHLGLPSCKKIQNGFLQETFWQKAGSIFHVYNILRGELHLLHYAWPPDLTIDTKCQFYNILRYFRCKMLYFYNSLRCKSSY